jgi:hypothetical protein
MSISKTDILNRALTLVGASPVVSITDGTNNARVLSRVYESALRAILSECKWNFATKRASLSEVTVTLDWYDTAQEIVYQKPVDMIRIYGASDSGALWREEGDYIISDTSDLGLRYVYYLDDPTKYPSFFTEAFTDKLCSDIAFAIVNSASLGEKFKTLYEGISLPKAMSANSQTGIQQSLQDDAWTLAKYSNGNEAV